MVKPETVIKCSKLYEQEKNLIEYLAKFGSNLEKCQAMLIKNIALTHNNERLF